MCGEWGWWVGFEPTVEGIEPTHTGENEVVEDHLFS